MKKWLAVILLSLASNSSFALTYEITQYGDTVWLPLWHKTSCTLSGTGVVRFYAGDANNQCIPSINGALACGSYPVSSKPVTLSRDDNNNQQLAWQGFQLATGNSDVLVDCEPN